MQHTVFPLEGMKVQLIAQQSILTSGGMKMNGCFTPHLMMPMDDFTLVNLWKLEALYLEFISDLSGTFTMERRFD